MKKIAVILIIFLVIVVGLMMHSGAISNNAHALQINTGKLFNRFNSIEPKLVSADNDFGFKMFSKLNGDEQFKRNVFISPSSISLALSMTLNGAGSSTAKSMSKALGFDGMKLDEVNKGNANMMKSLEYGDPKVEISIANSLWLDKDFTFKKDFLNRTVRAYQADVETLNFTDPDAAQKVNGWVSKSTKGNIKEIVDPSMLNDLTAMLLVNAIYFNGKWTKPFKPESTSDMPFHLADKSSKQVRMMYDSDKYRYMENSEFQAISLPYGDKRFSLYVFLPSKKSSLDEFCKSLNSTNWRKWLSSMIEKEGDIKLPRFKMEYDASLKKILSQIGMADAFKQSADFTGMSDVKPLFINEVVHKTFLEVDEQGTKAVASTVVILHAISSTVPTGTQPFEMIVDRPFFCAIVDNQSGLIMFMGAITNP